MRWARRIGYTRRPLRSVLDRGRWCLFLRAFPLIVRDAMNCLGADGGVLFALTRPGSTALFAVFAKGGKEMPCAPVILARSTSLRAGLRRKENGGSCCFAARLRCPRLAPLISGRTLKSCPDTCLAVDAESFVTKESDIMWRAA
jgi:hypothetical protein